MKISKRELIKRDKILGNPKNCKRWLVWFRTFIDNGINKTQECCGSSAWYPLDGRLNIETIKNNIKSSNAYRYRPIDATHYRIWQGSILNGNYVTDIISI